jgi:hypothetical protein
MGVGVFGGRDAAWRCGLFAGLMAAAMGASAQVIPPGPELDALIARKSGYWHVQVWVNGEGPDIATACLDFAQEAKQIRDLDKAGVGLAGGCTKPVYTRTAAGIEAVGGCGTPAPRSTYSGNTSSSQTLIQLSPSIKMTVKMISTFKGASCPHGMKAGDTMTEEEFKNPPKPGKFTNVYNGTLSDATGKAADAALEGLFGKPKKTK